MNNSSKKDLTLTEDEAQQIANWIDNEISSFCKDNNIYEEE